MGRHVCPMRLLHNVPFTLVHVDDGPPEWFAVDTGAPISLFDQRLASRVRHRPVSADSDLYAFDGVSMGDARLDDVVGAIANLDDLRAHTGIALAGIIGISTFQHMLLTLDYPGKQIVLERGALPDVDQRDVLVLTLNNYHPAIAVRLLGEPRLCELDSGSAFFLETNASAFTALPLAAPSRIVARINTISGDANARSARLKGTLTIGTHVVDDPVVMTQEQPVDDSLLEVVVRVGGPLLKHFVVTLDLASGKARFVAREPFAAEPVRTLGLSFLRDASGWYVAGALPGLPTYGVEVGDRVVSVDGAPSMSLDAEAFYPSPTDLSRRMVLTRADRTFEVTIATTVVVP